MCCSAIASSSPVLTPGRTAAFTAAMAPAVISPEARMSSISCAVLIWIIRPLHFASSGTRDRIPAVIALPLYRDRRSVFARLRALGRPERGKRPLGDLLDRPDGVDPGEKAG